MRTFSFLKPLITIDHAIGDTSYFLRRCIQKMQGRLLKKSVPMKRAPVSRKSMVIGRVKLSGRNFGFYKHSIWYELG